MDKSRENAMRVMIFKNRDDAREDVRARARNIIISEIKPNRAAAAAVARAESSRLAGKSETFRNRCGGNSVRPRLKLKPVRAV